MEAYVALLRYADDAAALSRSLCPSCLGIFVKATYRTSLGLVSSTASGQKEHGWLDVTMIATSVGDLVLAPKNENRAWLFGKSERQKRSSVRYPGKPPGGFGRLRGHILGRFARGRQLHFTPELTYIWMAELLWEWLLLGYPYSLLRALAHSLPPWPEARLLRQLIRGFGDSLRAMGGDGRKDGHRWKLSQCERMGLDFSVHLGRCGPWASWVSGCVIFRVRALGAGLERAAEGHMAERNALAGLAREHLLPGGSTNGLE